MTLILISRVFHLDSNLYFFSVIVLCLYDYVPIPVPAVITWRVQISGLPVRPSPSGQLINSVSHLRTFMLTSERPHSTYCIFASSDGANYSQRSTCSVKSVTCLFFLLHRESWHLCQWGCVKGNIWPFAPCLMSVFSLRTALRDYFLFIRTPGPHISVLLV